MTTKQLPALTFDHYGEPVTVTATFGHYANERLAISLVDEIGDPFTTVTVNLPDAHLNEGEVAIKDWDVNEPVVAAMVAAGWLVPTGREVSSGFVFPKVMKPAGDLAKGIEWFEEGYAPEPEGNTIRDVLYPEWVRALVMRTIFCPRTGEVLDVRTCVVLEDVQGDPAYVLSQKGWTEVVAEGGDKVLREKGLTVNEKSVKP